MQDTKYNPADKFGWKEGDLREVTPPKAAPPPPAPPPDLPKPSPSKHDDF
jgi:hypothetical protein